jgi:hypothetical protein
LDDLVTVARGLVEQDQNGRPYVAATESLTAARTEATAKHLVAATKWAAAVSPRASTATASASPRTTVALGALPVIVFVKFLIH